MRTLFFDTETTGLVRENRPATDPIQPMPVQIGVKFDAPNRREMVAMNYLIALDAGVEMHPKALETHGISLETTRDYGLHLITGVEAFLDLVGHADICVAHNARFDVTVMRHAAFLYANEVGIEYRDPFEGKRLFCTMLGALNIVKATPKRNGEWKWPKLEECVRFFWNESLEGAHDALTDVRACARVYYHLMEINYEH